MTARRCGRREPISPQARRRQVLIGTAIGFGFLVACALFGTLICAALSS